MVIDKALIEDIKSSTNDDEVDNCAQEATVCDTVP